MPSSGSGSASGPVLGGGGLPTLVLPQPPDALLYPHAGTVWRVEETYAGDGKLLAREWAVVAGAVRLYLQTSPSQFELQGFLLSEGDNIFTLDIGHFPDAASPKPGDVLKMTAAPPLLLGGFWTIRGDTQPVTFIAGKQKFVMARLAQPPTGVS